MKSNDPKFNSTATEIESNLRDHIKDEESRIFPGLDSKLSDTQKDALATLLENGKKVAPQEPHPLAPNTAPWNTMGAPILAFMDKLKDAVGMNAKKIKNMLML